MFIQSSIDEYGLFPLFGGSLQSAAANLCTGFLCGNVIPWSETAGPHGGFMFNILRNCQAVFQSDCTILHFQQ